MPERAPPGLLRFLWRTYVETIDGRTRRGDVDILAEAAERHDWPDAPEMGKTIADLLRAAYCKRAEGDLPGDRLARDREIVGLAEIHRAQGMSTRASAERIGAIYGMEPEAVRQVVRRKRGDK